MNVEILNFSNLPSKEQHVVADLVSRFTNGKSGEIPQMLPVTPEEVMTKNWGLIAQINSKFSGYIGAVATDTHDGAAMAEVGTLWVPPESRRNKIASNIADLLVSHITREVVDIGVAPYAFCNKLSLPVFKGAGYNIKTARDVPSSALSACDHCPAKPATGCCDTIVVYKGDKNDN